MATEQDEAMGDMERDSFEAGMEEGRRQVLREIEMYQREMGACLAGMKQRKTDDYREGYCHGLECAASAANTRWPKGGQ